MQAGILMVVYVLTTSIQFGGFIVSQLVDSKWPTFRGLVERYSTSK